MKTTRWLCRAPVLALLLLSACTSIRPRPVPVHLAIWVTRWDYRTKEDIQRIMRDCSSTGFDTVIFQVRGNATAFYESPFEPWDEVFGGKSPGFDPLRVACDEARAAGLALHAWVNAVPGWRSGKPPKPPADPAQLYHTHPEWFLLDQDGRRQPLKADYYIALNPCVPAVREYIADVCADIAARYPVQGVHLDYIRFLEKEKGHDYPHDPVSLAEFRSRKGITDPEQDPAAWHQFKVDSVTELVHLIRERVRTARRDCLLTAAVFPDFLTHKENVMQDAPAWLKLGYVDAVFPMAYGDNDERFAKTIRTAVDLTDGFPVIAGIGAYKHKVGEQTVRQIETARAQGAQGVAVFSYSSLFPTGAEASAQKKPKPTPESQARDDRRRAIVAYVLARGQ